MSEESTTVGLDRAKNVFQVHGGDGKGRAVLRKITPRICLTGSPGPDAGGIRPLERDDGADGFL
jgi:hypothetical protein